MARQVATGIDIGTSSVKVVISEALEEKSQSGESRSSPRIIGTGQVEAKGIQRGYITSQHETAESVRAAVSMAEKTAGAKVKRAFVSIGGVGLSAVTTTGSVIISRADLEVSERDMEMALEAAEVAIPAAASINRKIINTIPVEWKADGKPILGRVDGLKAQKLEVKALFITCLEHHLEDLIRTIEEAGIEVIDVVASPIAASFVTLSKKQKKAGCLLADIGAETLSIVVFENNIPVSLEVFPIGGTDVTHDIALGLKVPLEEAEAIKVGSLTRASFSKKKLDEIVSARAADCFELIETHLKKIDRNELLPAGIILTGGGAATGGVRELAETSLKLPASVSEIHFGSGEKSKIKDTAWSTALGLAIVGFNAEDEQGSVGLRSVDKLKEKGRRGMRTVSDWVSQFLP